MRKVLRFSGVNFIISLWMECCCDDKLCFASIVLLLLEYEYNWTWIENKMLSGQRQKSWNVSTKAKENPHIVWMFLFLFFFLMVCQPVNWNSHGWKNSIIIIMVMYWQTHVCICNMHYTNTYSPSSSTQGPRRDYSTKKK